MFNIANTLHGDIVKELLQHALLQRHAVTEEGNKKESILISDHWKSELSSLPFNQKVSDHPRNSYFDIEKRKNGCTAQVEVQDWYLKERAKVV